MRYQRFLAAGLGAMTLAMPGPSWAADDAAFVRAVAAVRERMAPIDAMENVIPGRVIVAVANGRAPVIDVHGVANAETGDAADENTPFYIASMTKAFVGLMAVRLDEQGIMPLDLTVASAFPAMAIDGVDLTKVTMRDLLSHQRGFRADALNFRTAYTDAVPASEIEQVVNASGRAIAPGFDYSNLGYLLYAAALERRTGKSWKAWLDQQVFMPLGMDHSSARTSDLPRSSANHERYDDGWLVFAPKGDAIMHAAGGLVVSGEDMAKWLAANAGAQSAIGAETFAHAQAAQVAVDRKEGPMVCTGYAFGWARCTAFGIEFLEHGGSYVGMRGEMVVIPASGVGFAALFNSDSMTGGLSSQLVRTFVAAYAGDNDIPSPDAFAAHYAELAARYRQTRTRERDALLESEGEVEAHTAASLDSLREATGSFRNPAYGVLELAVAKGALVGTLNGMELILSTTRADAMLARPVTDSEWEPFAFERGAAGKVEATILNGNRFARAPG